MDSNRSSRRQRWTGLTLASTQRLKCATLTITLKQSSACCMQHSTAQSSTAQHITAHSTRQHITTQRSMLCATQYVSTQSIAARHASQLHLRLESQPSAANLLPHSEFVSVLLHTQKCQQMQHTATAHSQAPTSL
jgi:hypothetical protein